MCTIISEIFWRDRILIWCVKFHEYHYKSRLIGSVRVWSRGRPIIFTLMMFYENFKTIRCLWHSRGCKRESGGDLLTNNYNWLNCFNTTLTGFKICRVRACVFSNNIYLIIKLINFNKFRHISECSVHIYIYYK